MLANFLLDLGSRMQRREFMKQLGVGLGVSLGLPRLEVFGDARKDDKAPVRLAWIFAPNGVVMPSWTPEKVGANFQFSRSLKPLQDYRDNLNVISGLAQNNARPHGDGAGGHARCAATFLTAAHPTKTSGADIRNGVSVDQVAARRLGVWTRIPSLELGTELGRNAGSCDSGYSCAYSNNISWKSPTTPNAKEVHPKLVFERLFAAGKNATESNRRRDFYRKSILDLVGEQASELRKQLGRTDRFKIDEYLASVRDVERRIQRSQKFATLVPESKIDPEQSPPDHASFQEHVRLMFDMMALAFQTDSTRVATMMLANAGSNRVYGVEGVSDGHHILSHHRGDENTLRKLESIDQFLVSQFAYFVGRLQAIKEGESTLLDNCAIMYASGISDADRHSHGDLPCLLVGNAGGSIETGRHIVMPTEVPMANLFVSMLNHASVPTDSFGDSTGALSAI